MSEIETLCRKIRGREDLHVVRISAASPGSVMAANKDLSTEVHLAVKEALLKSGYHLAGLKALDEARIHEFVAVDQQNNLEFVTLMDLHGVY